jgi:hypothetical protein
MAKRWLLSCFFAFVICGLSFYLAYFAGLIYAALSGPLNPANTPRLAGSLRHIAAPVSMALGVGAFIVCFRRYGKA